MKPSIVKLTVCPALIATLFLLPGAEKSHKKPAVQKKAEPFPPRPGVKAAGVQRPIANIKPDAVFPVEGVPDWLAVAADAVWVANKPKNTIHRLDVKSGKVSATVEVGKLPCSGLTTGFGSVWAPLCGDKALARVDLATNKLVATIPAGPADTEGELVTSPDSVWMLGEPSGSLLRIDPGTNRVVAEIMVPRGSYACSYGEGAVWVSGTESNVLTRVDPKTNLVTHSIEVGPQPRFLTFGEGAVWTLNQGDGTVSRVDAKANKLVATIELGVPGKGGEIAYGEGSVWVTAFQIPLTQIDPATNKVVKQWMGLGGDSVRVGHGSVWLTNIREQNIWRINPKGI
jgi:virginiamycin B lyase